MLAMIHVYKCCCVLDGVELFSSISLIPSQGAFSASLTCALLEGQELWGEPHPQQDNRAGANRKDTSLLLLQEIAQVI